MLQRRSRSELVLHCAQFCTANLMVFSTGMNFHAPKWSAAAGGTGEKVRMRSKMAKLRMNVNGLYRAPREAKLEMGKHRADPALAHGGVLSRRAEIAAKNVYGH